MNPAILQLITTMLPEFFALIREKRAKDDPNAPPITDEQIHAAMLMWLAGTVAKDDAIINRGG